jgi:hypothetical protein
MRMTSFESINCSGRKMGAQIFAEFFIGSPFSRRHAMSSPASQLTPWYRECTGLRPLPQISNVGRRRCRPGCGDLGRGVGRHERLHEELRSEGKRPSRRKSRTHWQCAPIRVPDTSGSRPAVYYPDRKTRGHIKTNLRLEEKGRSVLRSSIQCLSVRFFENAVLRREEIVKLICKYLQIDLH